MCGGVEIAGQYTNTGLPVRVYFPNPKAALPVLQADGSVEWIAWGRRREQPGRLPATGWARVDSITAGKWARYQPQEVRMPAVRFMEKTQRGNRIGLICGPARCWKGCCWKEEKNGGCMW